MFDNRGDDNHLPVLEGDRIQLKVIEMIDGVRLESILSDLRTIQLATSNQEPLYFGSERMLQQILSRSAENFIHFGIWLREIDELIGLISFQHWSKLHSKATLGYMIDHHYWNRGFATEAVSMLLEFGFGELGLHQVEGRCYKDNIASEKVMIKNGLTWVRSLSVRYGITCIPCEINLFRLTEPVYRQYRT